MKAVVATCFESNEERVSSVYDVLKEKAYDVTVFTSDFSHIRKAEREAVPSGFQAIHARPYRKNLSIGRMYSHFRFAKDLFRRIEKEKPDLIWLMAPANSLIREANQYKQSHPDVRLIIDIIDMWPESLPVGIDKNLFPFGLWKNLRKNNIGCCDALVCECDLYKETLSGEYDGKITTIHWAREGDAVLTNPSYPSDELALCYIGSINHIIDADKIASLISGVDVPVRLHVIGEGESTKQFLDVMKNHCEVIYHGPIRDEEKKKEIFDQCHAGINIYREGLYIGLTVKCIDYFKHGLPIINNIKGDTWNFVNEYDAGINIDGDTRIHAEKLIARRMNNQNIYDLYNENLTKDVFLEKCRNVIREVTK